MTFVFDNSNGRTLGDFVHSDWIFWSEKNKIKILIYKIPFEFFNEIFFYILNLINDEIPFKLFTSILKCLPYGECAHGMEMLYRLTIYIYYSRMFGYRNLRIFWSLYQMDVVFGLFSFEWKKKRNKAIETGKFEKVNNTFLRKCETTTKL